MENVTPERLIPDFGRELTEKIAEMMRHPKPDMTDEYLEQIRAAQGEQAADEAVSMDRAMLTRYSNELEETTAYLRMPKHGSERSRVLTHEAATRWQIDIQVFHDQVGDIKLFKTINIEIDEGNFDVVVFEVVTPIFDIRLLEGSGANIDVQELNYSESWHTQIMDILNGFDPSHEDEEYDPFSQWPVL